MSKPDRFYGSVFSASNVSQLALPGALDMCPWFYVARLFTCCNGCLLVLILEEHEEQYKQTGKRIG